MRVVRSGGEDGKEGVRMMVRRDGEGGIRTVRDVHVAICWEMLSTMCSWHCVSASPHVPTMVCTCTATLITSSTPTSHLIHVCAHKPLI